jgi:transcriptional regulator with XRE-family HTH domain
MTTWNDRLREARESAGIPKGQFARLVRVSAPTVTDWEKGNIKKIDGENLVRACDLLGVSPKWIIMGIKSGDDIGQPMAQVAGTPEPALSQVHRELIDLFDGLTRSQQEDFLSNLREKKRLNDDLLEQLLARRAAA